MPQMSEEERLELCQKLDGDLDAFMKEAISRPRKSTVEGKTVDEIAEELLAHPAFMKEFDPKKPMSPAMEALIALKYDCEDAEDKADSYKDDGNHNFKLSKYRWAIDNYTEGIKAKCKNKLLNAQLYTNRAASHSFIGNYRSAINDCTFARKFKPDHLKAIIKGAQCLLKLEYCDDAIKWCDSGLLIEAENEKLLKFRSDAQKLKKVNERDARKNAIKERKEEAEKEALLAAVKARGVTLAEDEKVEGEKELPDHLAGELALASLQSKNPSGVKVKVGEDGVLYWPVLFLYPEHNDSDFIEQFTDTDTFVNHIEQMFGPHVDPPGWDMEERKYKPENIDVYFLSSKQEKLIKVDQSSTLFDTLRLPTYAVHHGTPSFLLLVRNCKFTQDFLKKSKQT